MQARDGEQVRRAGPCEGVIDLGIDPLSLAEQEGGGQGLDPGVEPADQLGAAPGSQLSQSADE